MELFTAALTEAAKEAAVEAVKETAKGSVELGKAGKEIAAEQISLGKLGAESEFEKVSLGKLGEQEGSAENFVNEASKLNSSKAVSFGAYCPFAQTSGGHSYPK